MITGKIRSAVELHLYPRLNSAAETVLHKLGQADDYITDKYRKYKTELADLYTDMRVAIMWNRIREAGFADINEARAAVLLVHGIPDVHLIPLLEEFDYTFHAIPKIKGGKVNGSNISYGYVSLIAALEQIAALKQSGGRFILDGLNDIEKDLVIQAGKDRLIYQTERIKKTSIWKVSSDPLRVIRKKLEKLSRSDQFTLFNLGVRVLLEVPHGA